MGKKTEDQEIIKGILGKTQFLQIPLRFTRLFGPDAACMLVYIADKIFYKLNIDPYAVDNGVIIYRTEFEKEFGLTSYKQRTVEKLLTSKGVMTVEVVHNELQTYNLYRLEIYKLWELQQDTPPKKIKGGGQKTLHLS
jgi:hypothetical protein